MPNTYYDSELTGEQIEADLTAIDGVLAPENNGKVLTVENGKIVAKSASEWTDAPVLEPLNAIANGDYVPESGVDGFNSVHVAVPGAGNIQPLSITENGTYNPPSGVDGYAPVTVNVSEGYKTDILSQDDIAFLKGRKASGASSSWLSPPVSLVIIHAYREYGSSNHYTISIDSQNEYILTINQMPNATANKVNLFTRPIPSYATTVHIEASFPTGSVNYTWLMFGFAQKPELTDYDKDNEYPVWVLRKGYDEWTNTQILSQPMIEQLVLNSDGSANMQDIELDVSGISSDTYFYIYSVKSSITIKHIWWE